MVEKFEHVFSRFDAIQTCDGQTDRQTDRHLTTAYSAVCIASRGKTVLNAFKARLVGDQTDPRPAPVQSFNNDLTFYR